MADAEEKEKAEKLAAAKKRFEQLKKQKEKSKKGASQKKKEDTLATEEEPAEPSSATEPEAPATTAEASNAEAKDVQAHPITEDKKAEETDEPSAIPPKPSHNRQPSLSQQSRMRSTSFRRTSGTQLPTSPTLNGSKSPILDPEGDVTEIYRKQAARLDELEKENKRLAREGRDAEARWKRTEEELEELREANSELGSLKSKASQTASLIEEIAKLNVKTPNSNLNPPATPIVMLPLPASLLKQTL
ncbi:MAG: hypothetical protein Q9179_007379 [Wetmoreana sp. 5 TL-2023]